MSVVRMQPDLFPYFGYFRMIDGDAVSVFAEDTGFIHRGINRTKILLQNEDYYVTVRYGNNQNKIINEVQISCTTKNK